MLPLSALSRRALVVVATALVATVPSAEANTKPPLAFAGVTVTGVGHWSPGVLSWPFQAAVQRSTGQGTPLAFTGEAHVAADAGSDRVRAAIVAEARRRASETYDNSAQPVPANRIAVTLL